MKIFQIRLFNFIKLLNSSRKNIFDFMSKKQTFQNQKQQYVEEKEKLKSKNFEIENTSQEVLKSKSKPQILKESRINKYFRDDIKKYDGRLN
jgi:hypothetical protein